MSILKKGEICTIICPNCGSKIHFANKNQLSPKITDFKDIICSECIDIIKNINLEDTLAIIKIEKSSNV
jgi:hypothetical protein